MDSGTVCPDLAYLCSCLECHTLCLYLLYQVYKTPGTLHTASINGVSFAPYELGLLLACASSDGSISVIEHKGEGVFETTKVAT